MARDMFVVVALRPGSGPAGVEVAAGAEVFTDPGDAAAMATDYTTGRAAPPGTPAGTVYRAMRLVPLADTT